MKKILFICNVNRLRSPTAEEIYRRRSDLSVKSAGIFQYAKATVSQELVDWADIIFVMEKSQQNNIIKKFKNVNKKKTIINLDIPDIYEYMETTLVHILSKKLEQYIGKPVLNSEKVET